MPILAAGGGNGDIDVIVHVDKAWRGGEVDAVVVVTKGQARRVASDEPVVVAMVLALLLLGALFS